MPQLLPRIVIGGEEFIDISGIVKADFRPRVATVGLAIHHSVGSQDFPDRNFNGTSEDEEIEHIIALERFGEQKWGSGFPYNGVAFLSARVYVVGQGAGQRAHVANHNHELEGLVFAGTFTEANQRPGIGHIVGGGRWVKAKRVQRGNPRIRVDGHRNYVTDPGWATACPGEGGLWGLREIVRFADAMERGEQTQIEERVRRTIAAAIGPAAAAGDIKMVAAQIAWITGGTVCGK